MEFPHLPIIPSDVTEAERSGEPPGPGALVRASETHDED